MTQQNLAAAMVRQLAAWNVKVIFGVAGNKMLALGLMPLGVEVKSPDFSAYAWESGAKGFLVEDAAQLEEVAAHRLKSASARRRGRGMPRR